jgi:hypothetical protein
MDALRVEVVYRIRIRVVSVQKGPFVSTPRCTDVLTIEVDLPVAHLGDEVSAGNHGEPNSL